MRDLSQFNNQDFQRGAPMWKDAFHGFNLYLVKTWSKNLPHLRVLLWHSLENLDRRFLGRLPDECSEKAGRLS